MAKVLPAVVLKTKFVLPHSKAYQGYVKYIDREEARVNKGMSRTNIGKEFKFYMDYMGDEEKEGHLFNEDFDYLTEQQKKEIAKWFSEAEQKGSPMWQDVISFDNDWLEEQGLYNSKTHWLNERVMKDVVRSAMSKMIEVEKMRSPVWTASFHYNTDNIHVHMATVEMNPEYLKKVSVIDKETGLPMEQYRGKRKQGTLDQMKSVVANKILDRTTEYKRIDELIRDNARQIKEVNIAHVEETKKLFLQAMELLPDDLRQWKYGYQTVNNARPYIDQITEIYLNTYHKEEMEELIEKLDEQVQISERLYGSDSNYEEYKQNKLDDLKRRMGNAVLTEMRKVRKGEYDKGSIARTNFEKYKRKSGVKKEGKSSRRPPSFYYRNFKRNDVSRQLGSAMFHLNRAMRKSFHEHQKDRNIQEFDRMLDGYEYE